MLWHFESELGTVSMTTEAHNASGNTASCAPSWAANRAYFSNLSSVSGREYAAVEACTTEARTTLFVDMLVVRRKPLWH